ncbi:hypothetical protein [Rhizobium laguerreae]|uniref:hypothetical protein n=1 Tax=Rhizobium laguerreae TaxID=1076926 RepID=UPI001C907D3A|nr:hypothetical protein [Rhizobium laguerreae]MBY3194253.1 hypothetical protein [Rhizobium laguerreae]
MKPSEFINTIRRRAFDEKSLRSVALELDVDYQIFQRFVAGSTNHQRLGDMLDKLAERYGFSICEEATQADANADVSA